MERMLINTHITVRPGDTRRLDLIVPGLNVSHGIPLFCDVTVVCPLSASGHARSGTSNADGTLLRDAQRENDESK